MKDSSIQNVDLLTRIKSKRELTICWVQMNSDGYCKDCSKWHFTKLVKKSCCCDILTDRSLRTARKTVLLRVYRRRKLLLMAWPAHCKKRTTFFSKNYSHLSCAASFFQMPSNKCLHTRAHTRRSLEIIPSLQRTFRMLDSGWKYHSLS